MSQRPSSRLSSTSPASRAISRDDSQPQDQSIKTRIYIVDDHALIRHGLKQVINAEADMEVCGESDDAATALDRIFRLQPEVILVDISLKGNSGIELIRTVRAAYPEIRMIVVSIHCESIYGVRALRAGAHGYYMKQDTSEQLLASIRKVRHGGISVSDHLAGQMLHRVSNGVSIERAAFADLLSDRELEIAALIGAGMTTQEIAVKLHLSVKTVETHRAHIKEKLNLKNATQLVHACVRWVAETQGAAPETRAGAM